MSRAVGALRVAGVAAVVIAAMALGRVLTDATADDAVAARPFVEQGGPGQPVALEYADLEVTDVRGARSVTSSGTGVRPLGRFVVVDVELTVHHEPLTLLGSYLVDRDGRRFVADYRSTGCAQNVSALPEIPWRVTYCFDVPRDALAGAHLVLARSDFGSDGSAQRRDHVAEIALGIDTDRAEQLWATREQVPVEPAAPVGAGTEPPS